MKKILALLLVFILAFSCACGGNNESAGSDEVSSDESGESKSAIDPNAIIDAIDETVPTAGTYSVHSKVGIEQMAAHPDAKFKLLRNIDLDGAEMAPIPNFTGTIDGANYVISNFKVVSPDANGNQGFIGTNKGEIKNLTLENATVTTTQATKAAGVIAGVNEGKISRCTISGSLTAETAADGAACGAIAGKTTKDISNIISNVDFTVTSPAAMSAGGLVGISDGGALTNIEQNGIVKITDKTGKTAGLFVGEASGAEIKSCAFTGAENTLGGELYTEFVGKNSGSSVTKCLLRDNTVRPLPANVQALRDKVVDAMYAMGTVEWHVKEKLYHDCTCTLNMCHGIFYPEYTYYGLPYGHKAASLTRFMSMMDENNQVIDWAYSQPTMDSFDSYMQSDCSSSVQMAWYTVSNSTNVHRVAGEAESMDLGGIAVGDYPADIINYYDRELSAEWIGDGEDCAVTADVMLEAYALMRKGDAYWYRFTSGGHTRMVAEDPVVVRDQEGKIDADHSYVICHEQGVTTNDTENLIYTTWKINCKYTFTSILTIGAFPVTIEEFQTGEMETPEAKMLGGSEGKLGLITGTVKSNYYLDSVNMTLTDEEGNVLLDKTMYPALGRIHDGSDGGGGADTYIRRYHDEYDMAHFATPLQEVMMKPGAQYHCVVTAGLATGDSIIVKDFSFVNGSVTAKAD